MRAFLNVGVAGLALTVASVVARHGSSRQFSASAPPRPFVVTPFHASGIYRLGDTVGWKLVPAGAGSPPAGVVTYTLKRNNQILIGGGSLDLSHGPGQIEVLGAEPEMLFLRVKTPDGQTLKFGAAVAPTRLRPVARRPRDFDAFWKTELARLKGLPLQATFSPQTQMGRVDYCTMQLPSVDGASVYGQMARPTAPGKHPAMLLLQWASPPYPLQPSWVLGPANQGFITLDVEPHSVLPNGPPSYYQALPDSLKNYASVGEDSRETSYFVDMYLRDVQALELLRRDPDWDGKTLVVMGTSMGGQQSLCVAGLDPHITDVIVDVPSGCDLNAGLHGRQEGYPFLPTNDPKAMEAARYVDAVNFAPRIRATCLVAMGFIDEVAPPTGIWTAFNLIRGKKEAAPMVDSPHNNIATPAEQMPYTSRANAWLDALSHGRPAPVRQHLRR